MEINIKINTFIKCNNDNTDDDDDEDDNYDDDDDEDDNYDDDYVNPLNLLSCHWQVKRLP